MLIRDFYTYSWFSNLAYVKWREQAKTDKGAAIEDANAEERVSGVPDANETTLGERIFVSEGWDILDFEPNDPQTGFSATLFGNGNEKVLGIRGTDIDNEGQLVRDFFGADINQTILEFGFALYQTVSLFTD